MAICSEQFAARFSPNLHTSIELLSGRPHRQSHLLSSQPLKYQMPPKKASMGQSSASGADTTNAKVFWTKEDFSAFVDICVRGTIDGNRKGNGWGDVGWKWVIGQMRTVGIHKSQEQLKHKWDWMQKQFGLWQQLIGKETGLGWDSEKGTVAASNEWWEEKINAAPSGKLRKSLERMRQGGIGEDLYNAYCVLFVDKMATGLRKRSAASASRPPRADDFRDSLYEEGSGDSEEADFGSGHVPSSAGTHLEGMDISFGSMPRSDPTVNASASTGKSKRIREHGTAASGTKRKCKKSRSALLEKFDDLTVQLKGSMHERLQLMKESFCDKPGSSITEVMRDIRCLPGLVVGSPLHYCAGRIMADRSKREIYSSYETPEERLGYLQMEFDFMSPGHAYFT